MKKILIILIKGYQRVFSPDQGLLRHVYPNNQQHCLMFPTCSEYMILSIEKHGSFYGFVRGIRRILRCHPYQKKFIDPP